MAWERSIDQAAEAIAEASGVLVAAGAGMGVDSGLPDFRGPEGFWRAYPPIAELGLRFEEMANPAWFRRDPTLAWGFYGHRHHLYTTTPPHAGYRVVRGWATVAPAGGFVFTSNIDGAFQAVGFGDDEVVECHGSLRHLQCVEPCSDAIWSAEEARLEFAVDEETLRAREPLPRCPHCGDLARPNVLMFGDWLFVPERTARQERRFRAWLETVAERLVVVEAGAGTAVPSVRRLSESLVRAVGARLVRINPREPEGPPGTIEIATGALEALLEIDRRLSR